MTVHVFGIRHHGPGSSKSLLHALEQVQPDLVLVEGPPEGNALLELTDDPEMQTPVALLVHAPDDPSEGLYYPFASFSPEWQAIRFARSRQVPVQFMDLPVAHLLASEAASEGEPDATQHTPQRTRRRMRAPRDLLDDPLRALALAAGYSDGERWWGRMVEERQDGTQVFDAIAEAMTALRTQALLEQQQSPPEELREEKLREAWMRRSIRAACKQGFSSVAVVCGAWHVPALTQMPSDASDRALLRALPKRKVVATWIPWSHGRLAWASGYGAGVLSPGWYAHLFEDRGESALGWVVKVARLLRKEGLDVSAAQVIDAVRLAESIAGLRDQPAASLDDLNDAVLAVMLHGDSFPLSLIHDRLILGERLGRVPLHTPMLPLQRDLARQQARLRLRPDAITRELVLDLRKPIDRDRSSLLRRLQLLGVRWGQGGTRAEGKGTFKEAWHLRWDPECAVTLVEASVYGATVEYAAANQATELARSTTQLETLTELLKQVVLADLPAAVEAAVCRLQHLAVAAADLTHLMAALPALAQLVRYGDVRGTAQHIVENVVHGITTRVCIGLPTAYSSLDEQAADQVLAALIRAHDALTLLARRDLLDAWYAALKQVLTLPTLPALLRGRACRLLLDGEQIADQEAARHLHLALSPSVEPSHAASWLDGLVRGSGQLLVLDDRLWSIVDAWLESMRDDTFRQVVPMLRRVFSTITPPERRALGTRAADGQSTEQAAAAVELDDDRAAAAFPLLQLLLGAQEAR